MIAYLDSSAIIKQYLADEGGVIDFHAVTAVSTKLASSRLTYVEVRAALAAARRANRLGPAEHDRAVESFDEAWSAYFIVELTEAVSARAGSITEAFGLRAGDAIQLASALAFDVGETMIVAWDARLRLAARSAGVATFPVGT